MERKNLLSFKGAGSTLFGLTIVNTILTLITLGLYYPWAKVKYLKFYYQNLFLSGDHFSFHGTGKEIFKGFIKAILFVIVIVVIYSIFVFLKMHLIATLLYLAGLLLIIPLAIHGTLRYRLAKTSWRSIHFGYRGSLTELLKIYFAGIGLTIITFGIYSYWFEMRLRKYIFDHIRFGDVQFGFTGDGLDYFLINLKGAILTIITFGIYYFWFTAEIFRFYYQNVIVTHNGQSYRVDATATGWKIFKLYFVNMLIVVFTLGLGYAWARVRTMRFFAENLVVPEELDTNNIVQTEADFQDATGDSMLDFLDFNIMF